MLEIRRSAEFVEWLSGLRDTAGIARIAKRINRLALGNFGDTKQVGDGVGELRLAFGPGYRVYFIRQGEVVVILLCGGDKGTQGKDIQRAKRMAKELS